MSKYRVVERGDGSFAAQWYSWLLGWVDLRPVTSSLENAKAVLAREKHHGANSKADRTVVRIYKESEL